MHIRNLVLYKKNSILFFTFAFYMFFFASISFAGSSINRVNSDGGSINIANANAKGNKENTNTGYIKLNNTPMGTENKNTEGEIGTKSRSNVIPNALDTASNSSHVLSSTNSNTNTVSNPISLEELYGHISNSSGHESIPLSNYQTHIYGGSSTIISGDNIQTTSNYQQNNPQEYNYQHEQEMNKQLQYDHQGREKRNNHNSNTGGFYFNMTGPNGGSMSMGSFFNSNSSGSSTLQRSSSKIITGNNPQVKSLNSSPKNFEIMSE